MKMVTVADVADQVRGVTYGKADVSDVPAKGYLPVLRANNITDEGLELSDLIYVKASCVSERQMVRTGDIVVATSSGSLKVVGKAAQLIEDFSGGFGAFCKVVRPRSNVNYRYLGHYFRSPAYRRIISSLASGANINNIRNEHIDDLVIPLPTLEEQERIAAILDHTDNVRRNSMSAVKLYDKLRESIFKEIFGDSVENLNGWEELSYRDVSKRITVGVVVKPASYYVDDGVPAIRGTNIKADGIDLSDAVYFSDADNVRTHAKTRIWQGDLVIVRSGRPGLAAVVPEELDGINAIDVLILTPDHRLVTPRFLCDLINSASGRRMILSESRGQVQQHFNVGSLSKAPLFVPPLKIQKAYEDKMRDVDDSFHRLRMSAQLTASLFTSIQHRAFCGEL